LRLAIVYGGNSFERPVSINTADSIISSINDKYNLIKIDFDGNITSLINTLHKNKITLVFNALHGGDGENGVLQKHLEKNNILFTGSGSLACSKAMNKSVTKDICIENKIPVPKGIIINQNNKSVDNFNITSEFVVLKPIHEGSSADLYIVSNFSSNLNEKIDYMLSKYDSFILEEYITGKELTVGILDGKVLPVIEIIPKNKFYDYKCKYSNGMSEYEVPAILDEKVKSQINKYALKLHNILGCRHYSRIDIRLDNENNIFILEINTLPGMTDTSLFPKAANAFGITFEDLIEKIINLAKNG